MGLIDAIRQDIKAITTNSSDFAISVELTTPDKETALEVNAIFSRHHTDVTAQGYLMNGRKAHISVHMDLLDASDYPYRADDGEVLMEGHKVTMEGITYVVDQWFPSDTTRLLTLILGSYAAT